MAETEIKKIISIEASEGERSVKSLKKEISDLRDALLNCEKGGSEWEAIVKKLTEAQAELDSVTKAGKTTLDAAKDSIVGMEQEYKSLYNTYKLLTEEQRNSDFGKEMAESLNTLSEKLNTTKQGVGNFKDNVGHYSQSIIDAFGKMGISLGGLQQPLKMAAGGFKTLGASMKALIANPVGAIIMAIVLAFKALHAIVGKVKEAINNNEESQMRLKEAMASFQPIIDGVKNAFDVLGKIVVGIIEVFAKAFDAIRKLKAGFTDFVGITKGARKEMEEQQKTYKGLAQSQNDLTLKTREYKELNAKDNITVQKLRDEAAATSNAQEKAKLLNEAKEIQKTIDERNLELAQQKLHNLEVEASLTANDAEMNEKLAQAKTDVANAEAAISSHAREMTSAITSASQAGASAANKEREEVKKLLEELEEANKTEIQKVTEKYEKEKALLEKYHKDTTALTKRYNDEIAEIESKATASRYQADRAYYAKEIELAGENEIKILNLKLDEAKRIREEFNNRFLGENGQLQGPKDFKTLQRMAAEIGISIPDGSTKQEIARILKQAREEINKDVNDLETKGMQQAYGNETNKLLNELVKNDPLEMAIKREEVLSKARIEMAGKTEEERIAIEARAQQEIEDLEYTQLNNLLGNLEAQLFEFKGTKEQELALWLEYYDTLDQMRELDVAKEERAEDEKLKKLEKKLKKRGDVFKVSIEGANLITDVLGYAGDAWEDYINKQVEAGKMSDEQAKKEFEKVKNLQIAQATISMLSGITSALAGCFTNKATVADWILAGIQAASIAAAGIANINKIRNTEFNGSGSGNAPVTGLQTSPVIANTNPYTYTRVATTEEEDAQAGAPIWVSVTDINDAQNKVRVRDTESTW